MSSVVGSIWTLTGPGGTGIVSGSLGAALRGVAGVAVACVDQRHGSRGEWEAFGRVRGVRGRVDGDPDRPVRVREVYRRRCLTGAPRGVARVAVRGVDHRDRAVAQVGHVDGAVGRVDCDARRERADRNRGRGRSLSGAPRRVARVALSPVDDAQVARAVVMDIDGVDRVGGGVDRYGVPAGRDRRLCGRNPCLCSRCSSRRRSPVAGRCSRRRRCSCAGLRRC